MSFSIKLIFVCVCGLLVHKIQGQDHSRIRLVGGNSEGTGLVELLYNGKWSTVFNSYFTENDARVICGMLGFGNSGMSYVFSGGNYLFGDGTGYNINILNCIGNETDVFQCGSGPWNVLLRNGKDVGISCEATKVRLADGDTPQSGRVEILFKGHWSSVCDNYFGNQEARVICNMLGYQDTGIAQFFSGSHFGIGSGDMHVYRLSCKGTETDIKNCSPIWSQNQCDHRREAGVNCASTSIRLKNGPNNSSGRVEIFHGGHWGTICGEHFYHSDVMVICRMLGMYSLNSFGYSQGFYGEGSGNIIIRQLNCDGTETDIAQCQSVGWSVGTAYNSCGHLNDAGVNCAGKTIIRLVDGISAQSGRVEIYHNGHWGTISSEYFDYHDLEVICRMLGYNYTSESFFMTGSFYGDGIGEVVASHLGCNGDESDIGQCQGRWWPRLSSNSHNNDVGVSCDGIMPIRLVGESSNSSGRVEVFHDGYYGTICSRSFDRMDLNVVCRMLGFENIPRSAYWYPNPRYYQGLGEIVISDLDCNGIENSIGQCNARWPASSNCDHSMDVSVNCNGAPEKVRLVNGPTKFSGRVEIFHSGQWATICDDDFDRADAVVICRMLNFPHPERAVAYSLAHYGQGNSTTPIVLSNLKCNGLETNLGQCNPSWAPTCDHSEDIGINCCPSCQDPVVG